MSGLDLQRAIDDLRIVTAHRDSIAGWTGARPAISFQVTAQEANVGELPAIVRLAASLGVDRVKVNHIQVRFPSLAQASLRRNREAVARWNRAVHLMTAATAEALTPDGRRVELQNAVALPHDPAERLPPGPCPFVGLEAWVLVDGRFAPCPHPAAARRELGDFGSLAGLTLGQFWKGEPLRALSEGYEQHPVCKECPFRRPGGA
jgi:MoaA/NifB/PqqE/SkfB family radical SAM enzyme